MLTTKKDVLIPGKDPTQGIDDTTLISEAEYSVTLVSNKNKLFKFSL